MVHISNKLKPVFGKNYIVVLMLIVASMFVPTRLLAQTVTMQDYNFSTGVDASKWITLTNPTIIANTRADDTGYPLCPIGFTFTFAGVNYTQFSTKSNGEVKLGAPQCTSSAPYTTPFSTTVTNTTPQVIYANSNAPKIIGIGRDLAVNPDGYIRYQLTGTAPNRVLVVEFKMPYWYSSQSYVSDVNWEVQLFETSNKVQIVYSNVIPSTLPTGYQIGMCTSVNDVVTINPSTHTVSYGATSTTYSVWPGANRYYTFEMGCPAPTQFTASNITHNSADLSWVEVGGATRWRYSVTPAGGVNYPRNQNRNPFTLTGLQPNTDYTVCLESRCDPNQYPANSYSEPVCITFHTDCQPIATASLPYTENFNSYATTPTMNLPPCWHKYFYDRGNYILDSFPYPVSTPHQGTSGNSLAFYSESTNRISYLALPTFADPVNTLAVTFDLYRTNMSNPDNGSITVGVMTDYANINTFTAVQTVQVPAAGEWRRYEVPLRAYSGGGHYIALRSTAGDSNIVYLDNLSIDVAPSCTAPQDLTVSTLLDQSFIITWTERGTATLWEVEYGQQGFARGTGTRRTVNTTSCQITGLSASTQYDVYVRSICGANDTSNYNSRTVRTACAPIPHSALPYTELFDTYQARPTATIDPCWHKGTSLPQPYPYPVSSPAYSGSRSLVFRGDASNYSYAALPLFADNLNTLMLSFMMRKSAGANSDCGVVRVGVMSDPTDFNTFQLLQTVSVSSDEDWESFDVPLTGYNGSGRYITIASGNTGLGNTYIDNVTVSVAPSCLRPQTTSLRARAVLGRSATITWRQLNSTSLWYVEYGIQGYQPGMGRSMSVSAPVAYLTNLTPDTTYTVTVRAICGYGDSSEAVTINFRTGCRPLQHVYNVPIITDGFENYTVNTRPAPCWHAGTNHTSTYPRVEQRSAMSGGKGLTFLNTHNYYNFVTLPEIESPLQQLLVSFKAKRHTQQNQSNMQYNSAHIYVGVMSDPEDYSTFVRVADITDHTENAREYTIMLNRYNGPHGCIAIACADALQENGSTLYYTYIDDIRVENPNCPMPDSLFVSVGDTYADVTWSELGSATRWVVEYGPAGFNRGSGTRQIVNDTAYRITGLSGGVSYDVYVASLCSATDTSAYRFYSFTTACVAIDSTAMPFVENFDTYTAGFSTTIPCWHRGYFNPTAGSFTYDANAYYPQIVATGGYSVPQCYALGSTNNNNTAYAYSYFTLPLFNIDVNRLMIDFHYKVNQATTAPILVGLTADPFNISNFDTVKVINDVTTTWQHKTVFVHGHNPLNRYVVFLSDRRIPETGNRLFYIDNLSVAPKPTCPGIVNIQMVSRSYHNAIIAWEDQPEIIEGHPAQYELIINDSLGYRDTFYSANPYFAFSNLNPNYGYTVRLRANCSSSDNGAWATYNFRTQGDLCSTELAPTTTTTQYLPVNNTAAYSFTEQLYRPEEVGGVGYITDMSFYSTTVQTYKTNCTIYMGHTTDTVLNRFMPVSDMQVVYTGPLTAPSTGWNTYLLNTPFAYNGSESLVIAVCDNSNASASSGSYWRCHTATGMALSYYNNGTAYNGQPSGTLYRHNLRNNIQFTFNCTNPGCLAPNLYIPNVTAHTADLIWGGGNTETSWNIDYRKRGETNWTTAVSGITTRIYTVTGLDSSSTYDIRVTPSCSVNNTMSVIARINTLCRPILTLPFVENFESYEADTASSLGPCWVKHYVDNGRVRNTWYPYPTNDYANSGNKSLMFFCNGINRYSYAVLPEFGIAGNMMQVSFKAYRAANETTNGYITVGLMSDPDDFSTFRSVQTFHVENTGTWTNFDLDFSTTTDTNHYIAFAAYSTSGNNYIRIDDINVTPTATCPTPLNFSVSNVTDTAATFTFIDRAGASRWSLEYGPAGFTRGTGTRVYFTSLPARITTFSPNTQYDVYLRAHCAADDSSNTALVSFTTECSSLTPADLPYTENFDSYAYGGTASISPCWTKGTNYTSTTTIYPYPAQVARGNDSTNALLFSGSSSNDSYAAMPRYSGNIADLMVSMRLYKATTSARYGYLRVGVMTNPSDFSTFQEVATIYAVNAATWELHDVSLASYTGTGRYIAFASDNISNCVTYVDDIVVSRASSCMRPYNVYATTVTGNSATITWSDNVASPLGWIVEVGRSGFMPGYGMRLTTTTTTITVNGLAPQTSYDVYVYTRCSASDTSVASPVYAFTTGCGAIRHSDLPYVENFDSYSTALGSGASISPCWTKAYYSGMFNSRNYPYPVNNMAYTAPNSLLFYAGDNTYYAYAIMPEFEDAVSALRLNFKMRTNDIAEGTIQVGVTTSRNGNAQDLSSFTSVATIACTEVDAWQQKSVSFASYTGTGTGYIMLLYRPATSGANVFIDDIVVEPATSCQAPDALYAEAQETSATVHWTPAAGSTVTRWLVEYGPQGFLPGRGTTAVASNDTAYTITGLTAGSFYDAYVSALCGTRDTSPSLLVSFSTQCPAIAHAALPYYEDFEGYATGTAAGINPCWQRYSNYAAGRYPYATAAAAYAGSQSLAFEADTQHWCYVVLPRFTDAITSLEMSLRLRRAAVGMSGTIVVGVMDVASQRSTFHPYQALTPSGEGTAFEEYTVDFSAYYASGNQIAIMMYEGAANAAYVDNIVVRPIPTCRRPVNIAVTDLQSNRASFAWDRGSATTWRVEYGRAGFTRGQGITLNVNSPAVSVTGLQPSTTYDLYVRSTCSASDTSYFTHITFTTSCAPIVHSALPYTEGFEGYNTAWSSPINQCWYKQYFDGTVFTTEGYPHAATTAYRGSRSLMFQSNTTDGTFGYAVLPEFVDSVNRLELSFYMSRASLSASGRIKVGVITNPTDITTFHQVAELLPSQSSTAFETFTVSFAAYNGPDGRIALLADDDAGDNSLYIDEVTVSAVAACPQPANLVVASTSNSATVTWTAVGGTSHWMVEYGPAGYTYGSGTRVLDSTGSVLISGLQPSTAYDLYVYTVCGDDGNSTPVRAAFTTACAEIPTVSLPYLENFDSYINGIGQSISPCWYRAYYNGSNFITVSYPYPSSDYSVEQGGNSLAFYAVSNSLTPSASTYSYAVLPLFESPLSNLALSFKALKSATEEPGRIIVGVMSSPNDVTSFDTLGIVTLSEVNAWEEFYFTFDNAPANKRYIALFNHGAGNSTSNIYVDDVRVRLVSPCADIYNLHASAVSMRTIVIDWDVSSTTNVSNYKVRIVTPSGSDQLYTTNSTNYVFNNLVDNTEYTILVAANCGVYGPWDTIRVRTAYWPCITEVGTADSTMSVLPLTTTAYYSLSQQLYLASEVGTSGSINGMAFNYASATPMASKTNCSIYHTPTSDATISSFVSMGNAQLVYRGSLNATDQGWFRIDFQTPYIYNGTNNIIVTIVDNSGRDEGADLAFRTHTVNNMALYASTDTGAFSSVTGVPAMHTSQRNQVQFIKACEAPGCLPPALTVLSVAPTSVQLAWTRGNNETSWRLDYRSTTDTAWTTFGTSLTQNSANVTGLISGTEYEFRVFANCTSGSAGDTVMAVTSCQPVSTLPFSEDFDSYTSGLTAPISGCWDKYYFNGSIFNTHSYPHPTTSVRYGTTGNSLLFHSGASEYSYAVLPDITTGLSSLSVSLKAYRATAGGANGSFSVGVITNPADLATYTPYATFQVDEVNEWQSFNVSLAPVTATSGRIAIVADAASANEVYIDNVVVMLSGTCAAPSNLTITNVLSNSVTLSWVENGRANQWQIEYGPQGFTPGTGSTTTAATNNGYQLMGLSPNTAYDIYIRANCGGGFYSTPVSGNFFTDCASITAADLPYGDNFDSYASTADASINPCWRRGGNVAGSVMPYITNRQASSGRNALRFDGSDSRYCYVALPRYDGSVTSLGLSLDLYRIADGNHNGTVRVGVMTDPSDPSTFQLVRTISTLYTGRWETYDVEFASYQGTGRYVAVFSNNASTSEATAIVDNITLRVTPSCQRPTSPVVLSASAHSATLSWVSQYGNPRGWQLEYGPRNFTRGTGLTTMTATTTATLTGLNADYDYDVYIRAVCGTGDTSEPVYIRFSTQCGTIAHSELPYTEDFDAYMAGPTAAISPCWYKVYFTGVSEYNSYPYPSDDVAASAFRSLRFHSTASYYSYVALPAFEDAVNTLAVSFKLRKTSATASGTIKVGIVPSPADYDNFTLIDTVAPRPDNASEWQNFVVYLDSYNGTTGFITLLCDRGEENTVYLDDLSVDVIPSCPQPQHLSATTGGDTATITWTNYNNYSSLVLEYGFRGFAVGSGTRVTLAANATSHVLRSLREGTDYDVYLHAVCSQTDSSLDAYTYFTTDYIICPMPIVSTFEDSTDNERWHYNNTSVGNRWVIGTGAWVPESDLWTGTNGHGLYISNNNSSYGYSVDTAATVYAWHSVLLDEPGTYLVNFDWKGMGESGNDYMRVFLAPMNSPIAAGELFAGAGATSVPSGWYALDGGQQLVSHNDWQHVDLRAQVPVSGSYRIVFMWNNNDALGSQPPAAVDNLYFRRITCFEPTNLVCSSTTTTTATLRWNAGANESQWLLKAVPLGGGYDTIWRLATSNSNFSLTGLMPSTLYDVTVYSFCGVGDTSFAGPTIRVATTCSYLVAPYYETFEGYYDAVSTNLQAPAIYPRHDLIPCADYTNMSASPAGYPQAFITSASEGINNKSMLFLGNNASTPLYMILPPFDVRLDSLSIAFDYKNSDAATGDFTLGLVPVAGSASDFVALRQVPHSTTVRHFSYNFSSAVLADTNSRIAIRLSSADASALNFIDNLAITLGPDCRRVVAIDALYIADTTIALDITPNGGSEWDIEYGISGFARGNGYRIHAVTTTPIINGLVPDMDYDFYVATLCSSGDTSEYRLATFHTLCSPASIPFAEGFEASALPHCWQSLAAASGASWSYRAGVPQGTVNAHEGRFNAYFVATSRDSAARLVSPLLNIAQVQEPTLVFWYAPMRNGNNSDILKVYYRAAVTSPWTLLQTLSAGTPSVWNRAVISLPQASSSYQFAIEGVGANGAGIALDHVTVDTMPYYDINAVPNDVARGYISGTGRYHLGQLVSLTAVPNYGYHFVDWPDGNTSATVTFEADRDTVITPVNFTFNQYTLTVLSDVDQLGNPLGVVTGSGTYDYLSEVPVTVVPGVGYYFSHWSDGDANAIRTVTILRDSTLIAYYDTIPTYSISALPNYNNRGTVTGGGTYRENTQVVLTATPNYGYHFSGWSDGVYTNPRTITAVRDSLIIAIFDRNTYTVTVSNLHPSLGSVYGSATALYLDTITIGAIANYGYHFSGWTDGNNENPRTFLLERDSNFTATFAVDYYNITTAPNDTVMGHTLGDTLAAYLDIVELKAVPHFGYRFVDWTDSIADSVRLVTVLAPAHYVANFVLDTCHITTLSADYVMGYTTGDTTAYYFDTVTITAIPNYGYHFTRWSDGNTDNPRRVRMMGDFTYVAEFDNNNYTLTTASDNLVMGRTVGDTTARYLDTLTVEAISNYGYHFTHWSDGDSTNPRRLVLTSDTFVTAYFDYNVYHVTGLAEDPRMGYVDRDTDDLYLNTVCITAVPGRNYHFVRWTDGDTANPRCFTLLSDTVFTAVFDYDLLSVVAATADYTMGRAIGDTLAPYLSDVVITALPNRGYYFLGWNDGYYTNPRTVTVYSDTVFIAMFLPNVYRLTTMSADNNMGFTSGDVDTTTASPITISATPRHGYRFSHWNDGNTRNPRQVQLYSDTLFTAYFILDDFTLLTATSDSARGTTVGDTSAPYLSYVSALALPSYGYHFSHWSDSSTDNPHRIQLVADTTLTAFFEPDNFHVSVSADSNGSVLGDTLAPYASPVQLTAVPDYGYRFVSWNDGNTDNPRTVIVSGNLHFSASFTRASFHVAVSSADLTMGIGSGNSNSLYLDEHVIMGIPNEGYAFSHWNDGDTTNPRRFIVTSDTMFVAYFRGALYQLTLRSDNPAMGSVTSSNSGYYLDTLCFAAMPASGYRFLQWSDGSLNATRCIVLRSDTTFTAYFGPQGIYIAALVDDASHGTATGSGVYQRGDIATLTATPNYGYRFSAWSDGSTDNPRTVTVTADRAYTALFQPVDLTIAVSYDTTRGFVTGEGVYAYNSVATLTAQPYIGYHVDRWDDNSNTSVRQVTVLSDTTLTLLFAPNRYLISAYASSDALGSVNGGGTYGHADTAVLTALPAYGCRFTGWADGVTDNPRRVVITSDTILTALFEREMHTVVTLSSDSTIGTVMGGGSYAYGTAATITAEPAAGCRFIAWNDGNTDNPRTFTVVADTVYTALFEAPLYTVAVTAPQALADVFGAGTYRAGTRVQLRVAPVSGYRFTQWVDGDTSNPRTVVVTADTLFEATLSLAVYTLGVNAPYGSVAGTGDYYHGDTATLVVTPFTGHTFTGWSDGNTDNPRRLVMTSDCYLTAIFDGPMNLLQATVNNSAWGSVSGIGYFPQGSSVTLTAVPVRGAHFKHWDDGNTNPALSITLTADTLFHATFAPDTHVILVTTTTPNWGSVHGSGYYVFGSNPVISATPNTGYRFLAWSDGSTDNPRTVAADDDYRYEAIFSALNFLVTVTSNDRNMGTTTGTGLYTYGSSATITATAQPHYTFERWSDGNRRSTRTVTVTADADYQAVFAAEEYFIMVSSENMLYGRASGSGTYAYGSLATLTATPNSGYRFTSWSDGNTDNPRRYLVNSTARLTARFEPIAYAVTLSVNDGTRGRVTGDGIYNQGTRATITAVPNMGYQFDMWSDGNTEATRTLTVTSDVHLTAYFSPVTPPLGIDDAAADLDAVKVFADNGAIVILGANGLDVTVFDANGRVLHTVASVVADRLVYTPAASGVYLVQLSPTVTRKVVVIK